MNRFHAILGLGIGLFAAGRLIAKLVVYTSGRPGALVLIRGGGGHRPSG